MNALKLITILSIILPLSSCAQTEGKPQKEIIDGWKSFTENNYSIQYPNDWELDKSGQLGTSFVLLSPFSSQQDKFKENVNLLIQDISGYDLTLDQYVEISDSQIKKMATDGKLIESKRIKADGFESQKVIYKANQQGFNLKFEQVYWVIGDNAYVLTLSCEETQFENYQKIGEKILNSFTIK